MSDSTPVLTDDPIPSHTRIDPQHEADAETRAGQDQPLDQV